MPAFELPKYSADWRHLQTPSLTHASRFVFEEEITILVGPEERRFVAYKDVLCYSSKFFRAALEKDFKEKNEKIVRLPEVDIGTFSIYLQWAYTGQVVGVPVCQTCLHNSYQGVYGEHEDPCEMAYIDLYILGDLLDDIRLRNHIMDMIALNNLEFDTLPAVKAIQRAWASTPPHSKLRQYCLDSCVWDRDSEWLQQQLGQYGPISGDFVTKFAFEEYKTPTVLRGSIMVSLTSFTPG